MCAQLIALGSNPYIGDPLDDTLFQVNTIFTRDYLDPGGPFDRMLQDMNWSALRFPGGTVTEELFTPGSDFGERFFDVDTPSGIADDGETRILTAPATFEYTWDRNLDLQFVIPTEEYFGEDIDDETGIREPTPFGLYRLIDRVDRMINEDFGPSNITMVELGNEFWYQDDRQTPFEYGFMINELSAGLEYIFDIHSLELGPDSDWVRPDIAVQSGPGWLPDSNAQIFDELSLSARMSIDTVVTHFYPRTYDAAGGRDRHLDRLDEWQEAPGFNPDLDYYISEWNVSNKSEELHGLEHASAMPEIMRTLVEHGVDYAAVWGTQYLNLGSRLAKLYPDEDAPGGFDYSLTAPGEVYRMMSHDLRGLQYIDINTPETLRDAISIPPEDRAPEDREQLIMHAFGSDDRSVIFVSSQSDQPMDVTLQNDGLLSDYHHLWAQQLGVLDDPTTDGVNEGDPTSPLSRPYIRALDQSELESDAGITFQLGPYEIIELEFTTGDMGVRMSGHDQVVDPTANYDDTLGGSAFDDTITGHFGNDELRGHAGDDSLSGGEGNDFLGGWRGDDVLNGGEGNDTLFGGPGNDTLIAGGGVNELRGQDFGGGEDDEANHFIVDITGQTEISDFNPENGESLSFLRAYDTAQDVWDRTGTDGDDLVIGHDGGGETRLTGMAGSLGSFESFATVLADFQTDSATSDQVDALLEEPPDGSIPPDPPPEEPPPEEPPDDLTERELVELLTVSDIAELETFMQSLSEEELNGLLDFINPDIFAFSVTAPTAITFLNNLPSDGLAEFFEELSPEAYDSWALKTAARFAEGTYDDLPSMDPDVLQGFLDGVSDDVLLDYYLAHSDEQRAETAEDFWETMPETTGMSLSEIFGLDEEEIATRQESIDSGESEPLWGEYLIPSRLPDDAPPLPWLEEEEEEEDPEEDPEEDEATGAAGGGCFVATCAYGDFDHPDVAFLRLYRDLELATHPAGRAFIRAYYTVGPWIAAAIHPFPPLRQVIRAILARIVARMHRRRLSAMRRQRSGAMARHAQR